MFKGFLATFTLLALALVVAPSAVIAQQSPPTPAPSPTVSPAPAPTATPGLTPSPLPSMTPTPGVTPTPLPSATPLPTPLVLPPDAPPQILAIQVSDPVFHSGETISGEVITSTNVAAVELRVAGQRMRLPRTDFGVFQVSYTMPRIPFWMRKNYTAQVVAMNSAGVETSQNVTIALR
jgi:hypothetical protein